MKQQKKKVSFQVGRYKFGKLALVGDRAAFWPGGLDQYAPEVLDLEEWTEDSGISSDDTIDRMRRLGQSSEDESRNNSDEHLYKDQMINLKMKEIVVGRMYIEPPNRDPVPLPPSSDSERASPPLFEVELTASDEDDDASVLELVIPMQSSRYQRVPTSSPKKAKPKVVKRYFCSLMCCGRTHFSNLKFESRSQSPSSIVVPFVKKTISRTNITHRSS